jgi:hypothetical protein
MTFTDFIETAVLVSACVVTYILLFVVAVYAQSHTFSCGTGPTGPQGADGPIGNTGPAARTATSYLNSNSLTTSLTAPFPNPKSQPLPSAGIPYKTLAIEGDNAVFSWNFMIKDPSVDPTTQMVINLRVLGAATLRPFRTTNSKQNIVLAWKRPAVVLGQALNITAAITRNSNNSIIVTAMSGLQWTVTGTPVDNAVQNIFCSDMDFTGEDIFLEPDVNIPTASTERLFTIGSSVDVFKE